MSKSAAVKSSKVTKADKKSAKVQKKVVESASSSSDSSSSSSSDSSDSEEEEEKKEEKKDNSDSSDSSDSDDDEEKKESSESTASSDSESNSADNKRKAEANEAEAVSKKNKTEDAPAAASATVFVGGLSWNVDNDWLRTEFTECGEILDVRVITDRDSQRSKGFAYVEFATGEGANAALALAGKEIDGRAIRVDLSENRPKKEVGAGRSSAPQNDASDTVFVGNLSFNACEDDLRGAFSECGEIISIRLPTDRETGQAKGFGYIQFSSIDEAKAAMAWNGTELAGRACRLDYAGKKPERSEGGGGGFGGRGGRGGRGGGRGGFGGDRGGRGGRGGFGGGRGGGRGGFGGDRGGRGGSTNRGGFGSFAGSKVTF